MPIQIARVEPGLYLNTWVGHITMADVLQSEQDGVAALNPDETRIVLVNDMSAVTHLPMDVKGLRRVAESNPQIRALLLVKAPGIVRLMGEAQAKTIKLDWLVEFFDDLDSALARGQAILNDTSSS